MARILVVDDEEAIRKMVEQTMVRSGHNVLTATDGFDALKKLSLGRVDLVITDVVMPEMDGEKLIAHIRELYPRVKIIAMSGGGGDHAKAPSYLERARFAGASKTLLKPFKISELSSMVSALVGE